MDLRLNVCQLVLQVSLLPLLQVKRLGVREVVVLLGDLVDIRIALGVAFAGVLRAHDSNVQANWILVESQGASCHLNCSPKSCVDD